MGVPHEPTVQCIIAARVMLHILNPSENHNKSLLSFISSLPFYILIFFVQFFNRYSSRPTFPISYAYIFLNYRLVNKNIYFYFQCTVECLLWNVIVLPYLICNPELQYWEVPPSV